MALNKSHPQYDELQARLNYLRQFINESREEAIRLFALLVIELGLAKKGNVPATIARELDKIRTTLKYEGREESKLQVQENVAEITTEDILQAIQSLTTSQKTKQRLLAEDMRKKLRGVIATRLSQHHSKLPVQLRYIATAEDYINTLKQSYPEIAKNAGGADKLFRDALKLAEQSSEINKTISKLKDGLNEVHAPVMAASAKIKETVPAR